MTQIFTNQNKRSVLVGEAVVTAVCMLGLLACAVMASLASRRKRRQDKGLPRVGVAVLAWSWALFYVLRFTDAVIHLDGNTAFHDYYPVYYAVMEIFDIAGLISFLWIFQQEIAALSSKSSSLLHSIAVGGAAVLSVVLVAFYAIYVVYIAFLIHGRIYFEPDVRKWQDIVEKFSFAWLMIYLILLVGFCVMLGSASPKSIVRPVVCSMALLWIGLFFTLVARGLQIWPPVGYSYLYAAFPVDSSTAQYLYATDFINIIFIAAAVAILSVAATKTTSRTRADSDATLQGQGEEAQKDAAA